MIHPDMIQNILRKGESSTRRSSYLRSSFLLIKAFMYSESFFCISARRSQALPLPTGVLWKQRNQKTRSSSDGSHGWTGSFTLAKDPSGQYVYEGLLTHSPPSPHSYVRSSMRARGGQGCAGTNALARNKLLNETTIWRPLGGQTENVPSDSSW